MTRRRRITVYSVLAALGLALPYSLLVPWIVQHGADFSAAADELAGSRIGAFFALNAAVAAVALVAYVLLDRDRRRVRHAGFAVVCTLVAGIGFGLPLYLALREASRSGYMDDEDASVLW
jgi:hypothetical protein